MVLTLALNGPVLAQQQDVRGQTTEVLEAELAVIQRDIVKYTMSNRVSLPRNYEKKIERARIIERELERRRSEIQPQAIPAEFESEPMEKLWKSMQVGDVVDFWPKGWRCRFENVSPEKCSQLKKQLQFDVVESSPQSKILRYRSIQQQINPQQVLSGPSLEIKLNLSTKLDLGKAVRQEILFMATMHSFRIATQGFTRQTLSGPFFKDWWDSVRHGMSPRTATWGDGDPAIANLVGHPMMGAITVFGYFENHQEARRLNIEGSRKFLGHVLKAGLWSFLWSSCFELCPGMSEAAIGNLGHPDDPNSKQFQRPAEERARYGLQNAGCCVDFVITPVLGSAWALLEMAIDRYFILPLERRTGNRKLKFLLRTLPNPARTASNGLGGRPLHYRGDR